jgi:hypothetical protein
MLPAIQRQALLAFQGMPGDTREDLIQEVIANAAVAFKTLWEKGKEAVAYPTPLARYGIRQVKQGRKVGAKLNVRDVSSQYCQAAKGINLERLDRFDCERGEWLEVLVEDRHAGPAEIAAARIDINDWFQKLPARDRQMASALAIGRSTGEVARQFGVSSARISQKRREYFESWRDFLGENAAANRDDRTVV